MIDFDEVNRALAGPLRSNPVVLDLQVLPIVWAGESEDPPRPFLFYQRIVAVRNDRTLDNTGLIEEGYLSITVVDEFGKFGVRSEKAAAQIAGLYLRGTVLPFMGGVVTLFKWPVITRAFRDGPDWRQPMRIDYVAEQN